MDSKVTISIRGRLVTVNRGTKSDIARALLEKGFTVSEISKAVPMAYSQVHFIQKQRLENANAGLERGQSSSLRGRAASATPAKEGASRDGAPRASGRPTGYQRSPQPATAQASTRRSQTRSKEPQAWKGQAPQVGKLKTPSHARDTEIGPCANCGFDLVVRQAPVAGKAILMLVHVNITSDEYLNTVQFCQGVPLAYKDLKRG